jgi:hypothetical protein
MRRLPLPTLLLVLAAALLLAAGCARKLEVPTAPPLGSNPALRIISPAAGQVLASLAVPVRLEVQAFVLEPPGGPATAGHGYVELRMDGGAAVHLTTDTVTVMAQAPGLHTLTVELRDGAGARLDPQVGDSVAFTVAGERTLSGSVQPIFTAHCAVPGCHTGPGSPLGEDLSTPSSSHATTVNVPSQELPARVRVVPGDPENSYTVNKVRGDAGIVGGRMPLGGPPLSAQEIQVLVDWIRAGAKNN